MSNLKEILFGQFVGEGLGQLVEEMQNKYKPKKGRRFNHNNITYEISRHTVTGNQIEFEISSKIPEDELGPSKGKTYFQEIKKIISKEAKKPVSISMENIVWDSKRDTEKERDYVKLLYQYPLDDLYDNKEVEKRYEKMVRDKDTKSLPEVTSAFTPQGKVVLVIVREAIQKIAREHIDQLINANKKAQAKLKN